ncbi:hypothetical protein [Desulfacinum infernum]|uniref:hypothetical protein n=1 Tax=Desulfacinum infernum TaxID=35837 RepID=UPI0015B3F8F7|nr:hypothetical protein [Desulfacinum infernum]
MGETPESKLALYDFMMGALGLGSGHELEQQPPKDLNDLLNAYFYFSDQARFECCRRMGWTEPTDSATRPLIDQVLDPATYDYPHLMQCPAPTPQNPAYEAYQVASGLDGSVLMRRWLPEAVERFRQRRTGSGKNEENLHGGGPSHDQDCYHRHRRPRGPRQDKPGAPAHRH